VILAIETSSALGSVALGVDECDAGERVVARRFLRRQRAHAAELMPAVVELLDEVGVDRRELEGVVAGAGPGSFTGVRVAAATAKGLVRVLDLPLWAISSLAAGAATGDLRLPALEGEPLPGEGRDRPRCVLFDARDGRVYAACYRFSGDGVETLLEPWPTRIDELLERELPEDVLFLGDGALRHRGALEERGREVGGPPAGTPTADGLLRVRSLGAGASRVPDAGRWEPEYVRPWRPG